MDWLQKIKLRIIGYPMEPTTTISDGVTCTPEILVHANKRKTKELSSVYATQDFLAHNGNISLLKFSHDGRHLASAGVDGVVRIWLVYEQENTEEYEIVGNDSSIHFSTKNGSELTPINMKNNNNRKTKKASELTFVILPQKVFQVLEKPVHEFHGHGGKILSVSWSNKGYIISSSDDKTVRLWKIGHDVCLKVFTHSNFVTCVEFNPVDENRFISGSIDGKLRIWEINGCKVIGWIDNREIVTAICYYPNGKGCIVGTLDGNCYFYDIIDERLQLDTYTRVMCKKKRSRQITGFQFCPSDSRKVIVSSADSKVRVLCGINVVGKFKGCGTSRSQMSSSFTSDGKHIVSAGDDSNVYMWNHVTPDKLYTKAKCNKSSESFNSQNASVAVPWYGINNIVADALPRCTTISPRKPLSARHDFFSESMFKNPYLWMETLPNPTQVSISPPETWGLVIVTAGSDGRIRTYLNYGLPIRL